MAKANLEDIVQETLLTLRAKGGGGKGKGVSVFSSFSSLADATDINNIPEESKLSLKPFVLQYAFNSKFLLPGTIMEIIGGYGIGKTTFALTLLGMFMENNPNIPALYVNTEGKNKMLLQDRIKCCLSKNKAKASEIIRRVTTMEGYPQKETLEAIDNYVKDLREMMTDGGISKNTPIIVILDTLSKMMPKTESASVGYGDAKAKGIGEGSNLEFSKILHAWCRSRAAFLEQKNVFLIAISHQNEKVDMGARPSFISAESMEQYNVTKIGGKAIGQSAVLQVVLTRKDSIKNSLGEFIGYNVKVTVHKNSRGQDRRMCQYTVNTGVVGDTPTEYGQTAISFESGTARLFADKALKGTRESSKRFSSSAMSVNGLSAQEFGEFVEENENVKTEVGKYLKIFGYPIDDEEVKEVNNSEEDTEENDEQDEARVSQEDEGEHEEEAIPTPKRRGRPPKAR